MKYYFIRSLEEDYYNKITREWQEEPSWDCYIREEEVERWKKVFEGKSYSFIPICGVDSAKFLREKSIKRWKDTYIYDSIMSEIVFLISSAAIRGCFSEKIKLKKEKDFQMEMSSKNIKDFYTAIIHELESIGFTAMFEYSGPLESTIPAYLVVSW